MRETLLHLQSVTESQGLDVQISTHYRQPICMRAVKPTFRATPAHWRPSASSDRLHPRSCSRFARSGFNISSGRA